MCTRRSAPSSCFIHCLHIVAPDGRGQTASGETFLSVLFLLVAEDFASAKATKGQWKQTKSAIVPFDTFGCTPMFYSSREFRAFVCGKSLIQMQFDNILKQDRNV